MHLISYVSICAQIVLCELAILKQSIFDRIVDRVVWAFISIFVTAYILPYFGLTKEFGVIQLGGVIVAVSIFEAYANIMELILDFNGDRIIDYYLTLPIPSWCAILSKSIYFSINYFTFSLLMIPVGKVCLWHQLNLMQIDYAQFVLALLFQAIFFGLFTLFLASLIRHVHQIRSLWSRWMFPMWFMGGYSFSWMALYSVLPKVALVTLINPFIYITESTRASLLGQEGYLNFWLCLLMILLFSSVFFIISMHNLKKRLDYV